MSADRSAVPKQKAVKRKPRTWVKWAALDAKRNLRSVEMSKLNASLVAGMNGYMVRVRITEVSR